MKILIFGSNGLVGSSIKKIFSKHYEQDSLFFSTRADTNLFDSNETKKTIEEIRPDILINAAARVGGIFDNNTNRTSFFLDNMKININILESCISNNKIKIINLGSSCIYPLNANNPISEDSIMSGILEPTNSPYAMAKLSSIELGKALSVEYGHKVVNLMPTNLYGPNDNFSENHSHVIPGLIMRMHKAKINNDKIFKLWGTGKPKREFLYAEDLAYAIKFLLDNEINEELLNVGSGSEISITELSEKISNVVGFKGDLTFDKSMPDGNPRKLLDSSRILSMGWKPKTNLDEGLNATYLWFKNNFEDIRRDFPK